MTQYTWIVYYITFSSVEGRCIHIWYACIYMHVVVNILMWILLPNSKNIACDISCKFLEQLHYDPILKIWCIILIHVHVAEVRKWVYTHWVHSTYPGRTTPKFIRSAINHDVHSACMYIPIIIYYPLRLISLTYNIDTNK